MTENAAETTSQPSESQETVSSSTETQSSSTETQSLSSPSSMDVGNAFSRSSDDSKSNDSTELSESSSNESSEFHLNNFNFNDPSSVDDAKSQIGRMKSYINEANEKIKGMQDKQSSLSKPEVYEFTPNEAISKLDININSDSEQLQSFQKHAKEINLSQDQYNELVNFQLSNEVAAQQSLQQNSQAHIENVLTEVGGGDKEAGMKKLRSLTSQLSERGIEGENLEALQEAISIDSKAIGAIEHLIKSMSYKHSEFSAPPKDLQSEFDTTIESMATIEYQKNDAFKNKIIEKLGKIRVEAEKYGINLQR